MVIVRCLRRQYLDAVHSDMLKRRIWQYLDVLEGDIWMR